jgi:hypothetical protein
MTIEEFSQFLTNDDYRFLLEGASDCDLKIEKILLNKKNLRDEKSFATKKTFAFVHKYILQRLIL